MAAEGTVQSALTNAISCHIMLVYRLFKIPLGDFLIVVEGLSYDSTIAGT